MLMLTTSLPEIVRQSSSEEAVSVIHAPESFASWVSIACKTIMMNISNVANVL